MLRRGLRLTDGGIQHPAVAGAWEGLVCHLFGTTAPVTENHYQLLGVAQQASPGEIKRAFREVFTAGPGAVKLTAFVVLRIEGAEILAP